MRERKREGERREREREICRTIKYYKHYHDIVFLIGREAEHRHSFIS